MRKGVSLSLSLPISIVWFSENPGNFVFKPDFNSLNAYR